ncbi:MAG: hypothetical protein ACYDA3_10595 [Gaiellaceae bacterium]
MFGRARNPATTAVAISCVALLAALWELPHALRSSQAQVSTNAGLTSLDRELAAAHAYSVHETLATDAAQLIPRNATFYVATGGQPGTDAYAPFYAYWLLPRRHTDYPQNAEWIVDYGADPSQLAVPTEVVKDLGGGAEILKVRK